MHHPAVRLADTSRRSPPALAVAPGWSTVACHCLCTPVGR